MSRSNQSYGFEYLDEFSDARDSYKETKDEFSEAAQEMEEVFQSNQHGLGFPTSESPGTYEPKSLNARHREILRLVALGYKHVTVAKILGITPTAVGYTVNSPLGKSFLAEIHEARTGSVKDVHNRLQEMSPLAAEVMLDIMNEGKSETNKLRAAEKILEMTGHKSENKHMHLHTHLSKDEIEEMKKTANIGPETTSEDRQLEEAEDAEYTEE